MSGRVRLAQGRLRRREKYRRVGFGLKNDLPRRLRGCRGLGFRVLVFRALGFGV